MGRVKLDSTASSGDFGCLLPVLQLVTLKKSTFLNSKPQEGAVQDERLFAECCGWSEGVRDTSGLCRDSPIRISPAEIFDAHLTT